ncbi:MAG: nicotinate phosphoribosyltransferase [Burkholderiales bacterium]|nr:MAG: nicotinate phosphoribosyltransferase [Burkholderiales bacterium]
MARLLVLNTDSYKTSHWLQYPPGTQTVFSYIEARGGSLPYTVFFGLQALLKEYFSDPVTAEDVALAGEVCAAHGVPFNHDGWQHIVQAHGGRLPLRIRAVPEGTVVPVNQVLVTVENTDPACWWLTSYVETVLLRVWYPTTVATHSHATRRLIGEALARTGDPAGLPFKLHDFGARGVSSLESALLGGMAHLVNFQGTDTMTALLGARAYYGEPMAGFSIPAAEHSTITAWGRDGEADAYRNMLRQFGKPGALLAVVSDSYDLDAAVTRLWGGELREAVIASGAVVVIRPDSGDPTTVVRRTVQSLDAAFGSDVNAQGFKVLRHVRVIQGDGITRSSIASILAALEEAGYSADNVAFGQGGALLQQVNRDSLGFAMKASAVQVNGAWRDVFKAPVTDPAKRSKAGRLTLVQRDSQYATVRLDDPAAQGAGATEVLRTVWENGRLLVDDPFATIRARAALD